MIDSILVAVDDSEDRIIPIVEHTGEVAAGLSAKATLLHVYEPAEYQDYLDSLQYDSASSDSAAKKHSVVKQCASIFRGQGVELEIVGRVGDPATEIIDYIEANDVDHVVTGARKQSATRKAVLESVFQKVVYNSDVPCTIGMK